MPKPLLPLLASLLICDTATAALIAGNARAEQPRHKPMMVLAQNQAAPMPGLGAAPPPPMDQDMRAPGGFCENLYARKAGEIAFLEAKLQLNPSQQPLFARWKEVSLDTAKRREGNCGARLERRRAGQGPDMMDRLAREEDMLRTRLADIQAERPSLSALYASLTPAQKEEFSQLSRHGMGKRMHGAMGPMRHGREMGRRFGHGPDGMPPPPPPPRQ